MGFKISYKRLFTVQIMHEFFLNQAEKDFDALSELERTKALQAYPLEQHLKITPTEDTQALMQGQGMAFRQSGAGFFVGVRVNNAKAATGILTPDIPVDTPFVLRFSLRLSSPYFLNFSSLRLSQTSEELYYFSNRAANIEQDQLFLSQPLAVHDSSVSYEAGDLIVDDAVAPQQLFRAIRSQDPGAFDPADWEEIEVAPEYVSPPEAYAKGDAVIFDQQIFVAKQDPDNPPPDAEDWQAFPLTHQYVSHQDLMRRFPPVFSVDIRSAGVVSAVLKLIRPGETEPYYTEEQPNPDLGGSGTLSTFFVNISDVEPGVYEFRMETASGSQIFTPYDGIFYHDPSLYQTGAFGVVEIYHDPAGSLGDFSLVAGADNEIQSPLYQLKIKNRATFWRFLFNREQDIADADLGELERDGDANEKHKFKTRNPKPLMLAFTEVKKFNTDILLPNPTVTLVKPDAMDRSIFSEIFVHI